VDSANNVVATGFFYDTVNFGGISVTSGGSFDGFLLKLDSTSGGSLWAKRMGGTGDDRGYSVAASTGGDTVVVGYFVGAANFGGITRTSTGQDIFMARYDSAGTPRWVNTFPCVGWGIPYAVAVNGSGEIAMTGSYSGGTAQLGGAALPTPITPAIWVGRYDANGTPRWSKSIGGATLSNDRGTDVALDSQGETYITGYMKSAWDFGGGWLFGSVTDVFVAKYGSLSGAYRWANRYNGPADSDAGNCITVNEGAAEVIAGGKFGGSIDFGSPIGAVNGTGGITDGFLLKIQQ
jgi:hypothetical protein